MSLDMNGFLDNVKRAAVGAVNAEKPFAFVLGRITSINPLKIQVDQKLELTAAQLILTNAVRDFTVKMTIAHETESALSAYTYSFSGITGNGGTEPHSHTYSGITDSADLTHSHSYVGTKSYHVHLGLKTGEQVILLQTDGGQKYIVLDRVEAPT